jgi:hypothetical protein
MRKITLFIFLIVLLSVAFCHQRFIPSPHPDPVAREIADIIHHTENCNVIIASDEQLDHLEPTDYVPVTIYFRAVYVFTGNENPIHQYVRRTSKEN